MLETPPSYLHQMKNNIKTRNLLPNLTFCSMSYKNIFKQFFFLFHSFIDLGSKVITFLWQKLYYFTSKNLSKKPQKFFAN